MPIFYILSSKKLLIVSLVITVEDDKLCLVLI